jgi:thiol-disulfide isomerase/thioredoxin
MIPPAKGVALGALTLVVALAAASGGFLLHRHLEARDTPSVPHASAYAPDPAAAANGEGLADRPVDFRLPDLEGRPRGPHEWRGQLLVLNFWATWCAPCIHEIPVFMRMQERYADAGVQFLGVAIDEVDNIVPFVEEIGMNYPTVHGQLEAMELGSLLGNRTGGLPFTVFIGPDGVPVHRRPGAMEEPEVDGLIRRFLEP